MSPGLTRPARARCQRDCVADTPAHCGQLALDGGVAGGGGPSPNPSASAIEFITHLSTLSFTQRAQRTGVPYHLDDYVFGTHTFPYWAQDLREFVPRMMQVFAHPSTPATRRRRSPR